MGALRLTNLPPGSAMGTRALAVTVALSIVATGSATALGGGLPRYLLAADAGIADMIRARSPGKRRAAELTKTKFRPRLDVRRVARALPRIRSAPRPPAAALIAVPPPAVPIELAGPLAIGPVPIFFPGDFGFASQPPCGCGGFAGFFAPFPGIGGIGGGGGVVIQPPAPPTDTPPVVVPPPAAVPEPTSWILLILGFGIVGAVLRARRWGAWRRA